MLGQCKGEKVQGPMRETKPGVREGKDQEQELVHRACPPSLSSVSSSMQEADGEP